MSSQGVFSKDIYHGTVMTSIPKQYRVLLELHITHGQLESPEKQNAAQLTVMEIKHCQVTALPRIRNAFLFLKISRISSIPPTPHIPYPQFFFFYLSIPYLDRFSTFWLRLDFLPRATVKYHCTTFFRAVWGKHRTVICGSVSPILETLCWWIIGSPEINKTLYNESPSFSLMR